MYNRFVMVYEKVDECEWEYHDYSKGRRCRNGGEFAIIDKHDLEGTHIYHLCANHATKVMRNLATTAFPSLRGPSK